MAGKIPRSRYGSVKPYPTKDGSTIRELMHPDVQGNRNQSLAEATIPPGAMTLSHRHHRSEEIYHVTQGSGTMHLEKGAFPVTVGDTICILPGQAHFVENNSDEPLVFLCCCSPPYSHDDTEVLQ